jgi:integrase/recombinase XerD
MSRAEDSQDPAQAKADPLLGTPFRAGLLDFLDALRVEAGVSKNTVLAYRRDLEVFLEWLIQIGPRHWESVTAIHIVDHMAAMRSLGQTESSVARALAAIRMLLRHQVAEGVLKCDPCALISAPVLARYLPTTLGIEEVDALLSVASKDTWIDARDRALVEVLYASGARVSEAITLRVDGLEPTLGVLRLTGKGNKTRIVPIGKSAQAALEAWLLQWRAGVAGARGSKVVREVFLTRTGRPMDRTAAWRRVKALAIRAGIRANISPHTLRHSFASHLVMGGADLRSVQEMLGHASIKTTEVYTHLDSEQVRSVHRLFHPRA